MKPTSPRTKPAAGTSPPHEVERQARLHRVRARRRHPPRRPRTPAAETEIFAALLEASASELTSRQRAMAAATRTPATHQEVLADHEPGPPGHHHHRDHGDRRWCRGTAGRRRGDEAGLVIETTV